MAFIEKFWIPELIIRLIHPMTESGRLQLVYPQGWIQAYCLFTVRLTTTLKTQSRMNPPRRIVGSIRTCDGIIK